MISDQRLDEMKWDFTTVSEFAELVAEVKEARAFRTKIAYTLGAEPKPIHTCSFCGERNPIAHLILERAQSIVDDLRLVPRRAAEPPVGAPDDERVWAVSFQIDRDRFIPEGAENFAIGQVCSKPAEYAKAFTHDEAVKACAGAPGLIVVRHPNHPAPTGDGSPGSSAVDHPKHYTSSDAKCSACGHPIECIDVTRHMSFNVGNATKYLWRGAWKNGVEDLQKSAWYIADEIKKRGSK
jgi:hypothetical protein